MARDNTGMTASQHEYLTVIWTKTAVAKWERGVYDPRHTVRNWPVDIHSPWFRDDMRRKFGPTWVIVDGQGALAARS